MLSEKYFITQRLASATGRHRLSEHTCDIHQPGRARRRMPNEWLNDEAVGPSPFCRRRDSVQQSRHTFHMTQSDRVRCLALVGPLTGPSN